MIIAGISTLTELLSVLNHYIDNSRYANIFENSFLLENSTQLVVELLVVKPVLFYVKKDALSSNNAYTKIENFINEIIEIDDIYRLLIFRNLKLSDQKKYKINWIACEAPAGINKSVFLSNMCFIDVFLERNDNITKNTVGRLDYKKIENLLAEIVGEEIILELTKDIRCKYFLSCVLRIFSSFRKNEYVTSVVKKSNEYFISKEKINAVYRTKCYVCNKVYSVVLSGNTKHIGNDKYILPKKMLNTFVHEKKLYVELICQKCLQNKTITRPIFAMDIKPKSSGEWNNAFIKIYNSILIDENAVMQQSQNVIDQIQSSEKKNNAE